jgi:hypothetical protein
LNRRLVRLASDDRAIRLDDNPFLLTITHNLFLLAEGMQFDLVDGRLLVPGLLDLLEMGHAVVRYPDRADFPGFFGFEEGFVCFQAFCFPGEGVVDEEEVDVVYVEG